MQKIIKNIQVPTGNICVMQGMLGELELLSIGDYGKDANIKADFLGITRELNGVPSGEIMPLSEKWVVTISTQYGCSMGCKFCDVPKVGAGRNATVIDLKNQVVNALSLHKDIKSGKRLNVHYARMGEPTFNPDVLTNAYDLKNICADIRVCFDVIHPVISTMMPRGNASLKEFLDEWIHLKNCWYNGSAGLQLSINSTDEAQRQAMFNGNAMTLERISAMFTDLPAPKGRKYALNFALADEYIVDAKKLAHLFDPDWFMCKITPLHVTAACEQNDIKTTGGYESFTPYKKVEDDLKAAGFDVLVFVPSLDEDLGMITCGNAILSGKMPQVDYTEIYGK